MRSMTGYGAVESRTGNTELSVIVKSVNGRFLEPRFHLPKEYFALESQFKKDMAGVLERGTVDVFIHRRGTADFAVKFNKTNAAKWVDAHRALAKSLALPLDSKNLLERISILPQVFETSEKNKLSSAEEKEIVKTFRAALKRCLKEREREGQSLAKHLKRILSDLQKVVIRMEQKRGAANEELELKLHERLKKFSKDVKIDPARFAEELVYYLDKCDISEEIARLKEHLQMCQQYVGAKNTQGKKLDFYGQELLREVNTIGSKANQAQLTELVVEAKGLVESFKEQVQNIE